MTIYSPTTQGLVRREHRRSVIRRCRQCALFLLLLVVGLWGFSNYRADHFTFAWTKPVSVLLVAVVDPTVEESQRSSLQRFLSGSPAMEGNVAGVQKWFQLECQRWTGRQEAPLEFTTRGPMEAPGKPPEPPAPGASFFERWRKTDQFLDYFEEIGARHFILEAYDIVLFVYFFEEAAVKKYSGQHSVATRRKKRGVVFSPLAPDSMDRCCTLVAHELCHTLGATDKYVGEQSLYPDGFADPDRQPLYPQGKAEVMALGIPEARGVERRVEELTQCVIGRKTAEEVGWASRAGSP